MEWDLDGDGIYDTAPSSTLNRPTSFNAPGTRQVFARLTDALGASAISSPIALRVLGPPGDSDLDNDVDTTDYAAWRASFGRQIIPYYGADFNGNGSVDAADYVVWRKGSQVPMPGLAVPEPPSGLCACFAVAAWLGLRRRLTRAATA